MEPIFGAWADRLTELKQGAIDLAPGIYYTEDRAKVLAYLRPFLPLYDAIFTGLKGGGIRSVKDLAGRKVAVEKG